MYFLPYYNDKIYYIFVKFNTEYFSGTEIRKKGI